jgi:uncharacterized protein with NRDE domain
MAKPKMKEISLGNGAPIDEFLNPKNLKKGQTVAGTYLGSYRSGTFNSLTFKIKLESDGRLIGLSGGGQLAKKMANVPEGSYVEVTYDGQSAIKSGQFKGTKAHNFRVAVAADALETSAAAANDGTL